MLNLLRVEMGKLLRSKALWLTVLIYVVSITATFIPLRYMNTLPDLAEVAGVDLEEITGDLLEIDEMIDIMLSSGNFVQGFYQTSSGQTMVVMILCTIFIFSDYLNKTLQGTMQAGYSRCQVYVAKLICSLVGGWIYLAVAMVNAIVLGAVFYATPVTAVSLGTAAQILTAQCLSCVEYVAVFTAFAFFFGNGWAMAASTVFFLVLPGVPLLFSFLRGTDFYNAIRFLPSFIGINGVSGFSTLDSMLAQPDLWTASFVLPATLVGALLAVLSTVAGLYAFERKQL